MGDPLDWTVAQDRGDGIRLFDGRGALRATVVGQDGRGAPGPAVRVGRLPDGWTGLVRCEDGRSFPLTNGRTGGLRRTSRTAVVDLGTSRRRRPHRCRHNRRAS